MLEILPIVLCCAAQNLPTMLLIIAQYLYIMLKLCSIFYSLVFSYAIKFALPWVSNYLNTNSKSLLLKTQFKEKIDLL